MRKSFSLNPISATYWIAFRAFLSLCFLFFYFVWFGSAEFCNFIENKVDAIDVVDDPSLKTMEL